VSDWASSLVRMGRGRGGMGDEGKAAGRVPPGGFAVFEAAFLCWSVTSRKIKLRLSPCRVSHCAAVRSLCYDRPLQAQT
jgi:hypothetical protein